MKFCKGFAVISAAVLLAFGAEAQEKDIFTLEETAITATRTEIAVEDAPASVSVVTQEEIKSLGATTLDEVLRHEAGVILRRDKGIAMATPRVSLRGLGGDSRTLVMLDGMPLNDGYSSGVTWSQLGIENVERIEITRGPGSALYGGNALGGVINIITKKPSGREIKATVGAGSDNTRKYSASYGDMFTDKFGMRIGFEHEKSDGYPATTTRRSITTTQPSTDELTGGYPGKSASGSDTYIVGDAGDNWGERNNVNLQSYFTPDASSMITFNAQWGRHEYGYDRPHTYLTDSNGNPSYSGYVDLGDGRYASVSPNNFIYYMGNGDEEYTSLALMYDKEFENIALNAKVGYSYKTKWYTPAGSSGTYDNAAGSLTDSDLYTWYTDVQLSGNIGQKHKLTGGMTYRTNDFEQAGYSLSFYRDEDSKTSKNEITEGKDQYYGVYIQDEWTLPASFTLFTGIRYD
jgi:iron complex outermembrane receptor protein